MKDVVPSPAAEVPVNTKITATGHYDLTNEEYHGDCCDGPSLSASSIKQLVSDPSEYWLNSPLNPDRVKPKENKAFNVGTAAHTMVLEPELLGETISVIPNDILASNGALSTKAAKAFVAEQTDLGRTVIKESEWQAVCDMADAISANQVVMRAMAGTLNEQSLIVKDEEAGIYIKSRPDQMPQESGRFIVDLKTTDRTGIDAWERSSMVDLRYDIQGGLMLWSLEKVLGIKPAGVMYVVVCKEPPHRVAVRTLRIASDTGRALLDNGWLDVKQGVATFLECWETGVWPSPWDSVTDIIPPDWHMRRIEKRLENTSLVSPFASSEVEP